MADNPRIEELRRRVQADPASIAFAALAEEYRRVGRYDEAVATCLAGLQRHPAYMSARVTLGRALVETGDLDGAREQFDMVLRSAPENLAASRGLAQIHERLGHSTEMDPHLAEMMRVHIEAVPAPMIDLPLATPVDVLEHVLSEVEKPIIHTPDHAVVATLGRLEHFLGAIQHARQA
jgi:predicted Zn-dependent protease